MNNELRGFLNILAGMAFLFIGGLMQIEVLWLAGLGLIPIGLVIFIVGRFQNPGA
jgi:hypothetical protein